ncbi:MAG TPA: MBL fold metallo-hydrolase [Conexibacter sp.]|jgi:glyoxylase-like metal-dependent hydrolase (beta-lactamase superfamily II)/rhodanese-related sulfurtransferase
MIFRQLLDSDLGCASYLIGDAGRGVVVDPGVDVERIIAAADEEGVRIELVLETHAHADHVSGRALLAEQTGARLRLPAGGGYEDGAGDELRGGDEIALGSLRITALAAPGHRPEHLVLLVADTSRSAEPWMLLSGDSLLVGDLARPDLAIDGVEGARGLHETLSRLAQLPDGVELWPGHVGGSLCGGPGLSRKPSSTLGFERATNPLLAAGLGPDELAERLLASLPDRPPTVAHVVARNRTPAPAAARQVARLSGAQLAEALGSRTLLDARPAVELDAAIPSLTLLDARSAVDFDAAHLPGAVSLALQGNGLGTRAAWVIAPDEGFVVQAADEASALELVRRLRAVGLERVRGIAVGPVEQLALDGGVTVEAVSPITVEELPSLARSVTIVDVRDELEWRDGHFADAVHLPLSRLRAKADTLPAGPLATICKSGARAAFAASWLRAQGHDARRVTGGGILDLPTVGLDLVVS